MQQTQKIDGVSYQYDPQARAMCDALARALRVRYVVMDYVYETRLFPRAEAFASMDDARDALVRALRAYESEAEACERALRAQGLAELQRQQKAAKRALRAQGLAELQRQQKAAKRNAERRPLFFACGVRSRRRRAEKRP
jgi:Skp family chaperone for outer membrane proteins